MPRLSIGRFYASLTETRQRSDLPPGTLAAVHEPTRMVLAELKRTRAELEKVGTARDVLAPAIRALRRIERRLERPLRIAVIGEFNSGKSTLTNLLVRLESLPTAVISNTCIPTLLFHAPEPKIFAVYHDRRREQLRATSRALSKDIYRLEVGLPSERLRAVQILDLPGLADARFDGSIDDIATHAADVALWCTVSTQAWKESERVAWEEIPERLRSRGLLIATHCDLLRNPADLDKLLCRLHDEAESSFRDILPISTVEALAVARENHAGAAGAVWKASGAEALETAIEALLQGVRMERLDAAIKATARIAEHTSSRFDSPPLAVDAPLL